MNRIVRRLVMIAVVGVLAVSGVAWAQPTPEERAQVVVDNRQGLFKVIGSYFGPVVGMARGQIPYDGARVAYAAQKIQALATMIPDLVRTDTRAFDLETGALDTLWDNLEDVAAKAADIENAAAMLEAAAGQDQEAAMGAFRKVGGACKACHDEYRQQD